MRRLEWLRVNINIGGGLRELIVFPIVSLEFRLGGPNGLHDIQELEEMVLARLGPSCVSTGTIDEAAMAEMVDHRDRYRG